MRLSQDCHRTGLGPIRVDYRRPVGSGAGAREGDDVLPQRAEEATWRTPAPGVR